MVRSLTFGSRIVPAKCVMPRPTQLSVLCTVVNADRAVDTAANGVLLLCAAGHRLADELTTVFIQGIWWNHDISVSHVLLLYSVLCTTTVLLSSPYEEIFLLVGDFELETVQQDDATININIQCITTLSPELQTWRLLEL